MTIEGPPNHDQTKPVFAQARAQETNPLAPPQATTCCSDSVAGGGGARCQGPVGQYELPAQTHLMLSGQSSVYSSSGSRHPFPPAQDFFGRPYPPQPPPRNHESGLVCGIFHPRFSPPPLWVSMSMSKRRKEDLNLPFRSQLSVRCQIGSHVTRWEERRVPARDAPVRPAAGGHAAHVPATRAPGYDPPSRLTVRGKIRKCILFALCIFHLFHFYLCAFFCTAFWNSRFASQSAAHLHQLIPTRAPLRIPAISEHKFGDQNGVTDRSTARKGQEGKPRPAPNARLVH